MAGDWYCEHCAAKGAGGTKSSSGRKGDGKGEVKADSKAEASDEDNGEALTVDANFCWHYFSSSNVMAASQSSEVHDDTLSC